MKKLGFLALFVLVVSITTARQTTPQSPPPAPQPTAIVAAASPAAPSKATALPAAPTPTAAVATKAPEATPTTAVAATPSPSATLQLTATQIAPITRTNAAPPKIELVQLVDDLERPVYATADPVDDSRMYVIEQPGRIRIVRNNVLRREAVVDLSDRLTSGGNEQGLLGMAFSPNFTRDRRLFVHYSEKQNGDTRVVMLQCAPVAATCDEASQVEILAVKQPYRNHNGGHLAFGPDGMLWIGLGDGGSAGDPENHAQRKDSLLGKMLRIDVSNATREKPYTIPPDNPRAGGFAPEVWSVGLRNPWRYSFDRATGDLYIGDVGQSQFEEIDFAPGDSKGGENYGWKFREGNDTYQSGGNVSAFEGPILAYPRSDGCSVTGGYVYRGKVMPALQGAYLYGDYCTGRIWALRRDAGNKWVNTLLLDSDFSISSFGETQDGEILVVHHGGAIYRVAPAAG